MHGVSGRCPAEGINRETGVGEGCGDPGFRSASPRPFAVRRVAAKAGAEKAGLWTPRALTEGAGWEAMG